MERVNEIISSHLIGIAALFVNILIIYLTNRNELDISLRIKKKDRNSFSKPDLKVFCMSHELDEPRFWTEISKHSMVPLCLTYTYTLLKYIPNLGIKGFSLLLPVSLAFVNEVFLRKFHSLWWFGSIHILLWVISGIVLYFMY
jgi:hypothetical protein